MLRLLLLTALTASVSALPSVVDSSMPHLIRWEKRQSNYPPGYATPPPSSIPKDWSDALNSAVAAGKIPNIPVSTVSPDGYTHYPNGGFDSNTCSWTLSKCNGPDDITNAPDNEWTVAFDDGPTGASTALYDFLLQHNQTATHFMIGSQVLAFPDAVRHAMQTDQQVALHTWSHNLLTTRDNLGVVAELGWNMQILYDLTGRVPTLLRPPQGDIDNRVRAIAKQLFNLTVVMWNAECNDWCLDANGNSVCPGRQPGGDRASVAAAIQTALHGPKSPGVSMLEHELNPATVGIFQEYYPSLAGLGWKPDSVSNHYDWNWYANAHDNTSPSTNVTSMLSTTVAQQVQAANSNTTTTTQASSSTTTGTPTNVPSVTFVTSTVNPTSTSRQSSQGSTTNTSSAATTTASLCSLLFALLFSFAYLA